MEAWRQVFRAGVAPQLSDAALLALRAGLAADDPALVQGRTTVPSAAGGGIDHWPCGGACLVGYAGWKGDDLPTVGEVEGYVADRLAGCEVLLGEERAARHLLAWFDETPREAVRAELLAEVDRALVGRVAAALTPEDVPCPT